MSGRSRLRDWLSERPLAGAVLGALALHSLAGLAAWVSAMSAGGSRTVVSCFDATGAPFLAVTAVVEVVVAAFVLLQFGRGEALRPAWLFLLLAAVARLAGVMLIKVAPAENPFAAPLRELGLLAGGPLQMALLGVGLAFALRVYRKAGLAGRLRRFDRFTFLVGVLFTLQLSLLAWPGANSAQQGFITRLNSSSGPLLSLLLLESLMLRRSATRLHGGLIAECWTAYAAATFLSILADVGGWAAVYGQLPAPLGIVSGLLVYPAAAAYTLGPVLQATAVLRVRRRWAVRSPAAGACVANGTR